MCLFLPFLGELTANVPSTRVPPKQDSAAVTLPQMTTDTTNSVDKESQTAGQPVTVQSDSHSSTTTQQVTTISTTRTLTTTQEAVRTSSKMTNQPNKTAEQGRNTASTTVQSSRTGKKLGSCTLTLLLACRLRSFDNLKWNYLCSWEFFTGTIWKRLQRKEKVDKLFHGKWGGSCVG